MTEKKNPAEKKKRGRKSEYRIEYADQALKLCLLGATDKELAEFFSVSEQTLNKWKKDYPEFLESLKKERILRMLTLHLGYIIVLSVIPVRQQNLQHLKEE